MRKTSGNLQSKNPRAAFKGNANLLVQFYHTPSQETKEELNKLGIKFFDYIPDWSYLISIPVELNVATLENHGVRTVMEIPQVMKSTPALRAGVPANFYNEGGELRGVAVLYSNVDIAIAQSELEAHGLRIDEVNISGGLLVFNAPV